MAAAVRDGFAQEMTHMHAIGRVRGHKPVRLYYRLSEKYDYDLTHDELTLIGDLLGYQPGWAWHKYQEQPARRDTWLEAKTQQKAAPPPDKRSGWFDDWNDFTRSGPFQRAHDRAQQEDRTRTENQQFGQDYQGYQQFRQDFQGFRSSQRSDPIIDAINLLQLKPGFTASELKAAYRKYVMTHHPDRGGDAAAFQKGVEANDLLAKHTTAEPGEAPF